MKLSIFLYCSDKIEQSVRCINSILRQKNANIDLQLIFDTEDAKNQVLKSVEPFKPNFIFKGDRTNKAAYSELIEKSDSDYFMFALYNQVFTTDCFNGIESLLAGYDGAILNFSHYKRGKFNKTFNEVSYDTYFATAPYCHNVIFNTKIFRENPIFFSLSGEQQPFLTASYFSFAKNILFLDTVFYYKDFRVSDAAFINDLTYNDVWWIVKIASRLKKAGKTDCVTAFIGLYLNRMLIAKHNTKNPIQKLKIWYHLKELSFILF